MPRRSSALRASCFACSINSARRFGDHLTDSSQVSYSNRMISMAINPFGSAFSQSIRTIAPSGTTTALDSDKSPWVKAGDHLPARNLPHARSTALDNTSSLITNLVSSQHAATKTLQTFSCDGADGGTVILMD